MDIETPREVNLLREAVSRKLGRPAFIRKVLNQSEWFVYDPVFSHVQRGKRGGYSGYRNGYRFNEQDGLMFATIHSPILAALLKANITLDIVIDVLSQTRDLRKSHWLYWDSRFALKNKQGYRLRVDADVLSELIDQLRDFDSDVGFVNDLFPRKPNTGKTGGEAPRAGNTFYLHLADSGRIRAASEEAPDAFWDEIGGYQVVGIDSSTDQAFPNGALEGVRRKIDEIVEASWPLFLCLYPIKPIEGRSASLARNMTVRGILKECEFSKICLPDGHGISGECRGTIHGAHIKPDALGGSDRPENGLWLCQHHHRATEGSLKGARTLDEVNVHYVE